MISTTQPARIVYPESDGLPMSESDATRDYLAYSVEVLRQYFQSRRQIYVSGNLFIYYEEGNPKAVCSPDVFVIFGVHNRKRRSYKTWQENQKLPSFILEVTSYTTKKQDEVEKPQLYASLGVTEYFQYDPTGDYLRPQLKGGRLVEGKYEPLPLEQTADGISFIHSSVLGLDLQLLSPVKSQVDALEVVPLPQELRYYDPETSLTLLTHAETEQERQRVAQERDAAQQERDTAQEELDAAQQELDIAQRERDAALLKSQRLTERLRELGLNPDDI